MNQLRWDETNVRHRVLRAPVEYHQARHDAFVRERKRQEEKYQKRDNNQHVAPCGCVRTVDQTNSQRSLTVHFCPTHWKERKRA